MRHFHHTLLLLVQLAVAATAQPLELRMHAIDAVALPRIKLKVSLSRDGVMLAQPGRATFALLDNGRPMTLDIDCPDSAVINNVALVLDNSGSLSGLAFDSLKAGAHAVVDSLRDNDATAVYDFRNDGRRVQDFTTDKSVLHNAVSGLTLGAGTPLYSTTDMALDDLAARTGKKYCIVFTDGVDNSSPIPWSVLPAKARAAGVRVFIIGFSNTELSDDILSTIARETGGRYWRLFSPALIAGVLRDIAGDIVSPWCTISYDADGCTDSLRVLNLTASLDAQVAAADTAFFSPFRADTLRARVLAPARMLPGDRAIIYVQLEPGLHTNLELSFSFLLRYDAALLEPSSLSPVTLGTITQNTVVRVRELRPGVLRFSADFVRPGMAQGNLVGIQLRHVAADSSRPVSLTLDSLVLLAGCPTTVLLTSDTVDLCQCEAALSYTMELAAPVAAGETAFVPLRIPLPAASAPALLRARLRYDAEMLRFDGIDATDGRDWDAEIDRASGLAWITMYTPSGMGELRALLRFTGEAERVPRRAFVHIDHMMMYDSCCRDAKADSADFFVDGQCSFLLRRVSSTGIVAAWPNPASERLHVLCSQDSVDFTNACLELYDCHGRVVRRQQLDGGTPRLQSTIDINTLPPGHYTLVFRDARTLSARSIKLLRKN